MKSLPRWLNLTLFGLAITLFASMLIAWAVWSFAIKGETTDDRLAEEIPRFPLVDSQWQSWFIQSGSPLTGTDTVADIDVGYYDESHDEFFEFYNQRLPELGWVSAGPPIMTGSYSIDQQFIKQSRGKDWRLTLKRSRGMTSARDGEVWLTSIKIALDR